MQEWINYNGKLVTADSNFIGAQSRAFRYGDGLFETIKMVGGELLHWDRHMQRLERGMQALRFQPAVHQNADFWRDEIQRLALRNKVSLGGRIRLTVFRGNGGLFDPEHHRPQFVIEAQALPDNCYSINENGLVVGLFPEGRKAIDQFSTLKHNNYLLYAQAALYAKEQHWNDALVLNQHDRICDSSLANLFLIRNGELITPSLAEGAVAGVVRAHLLEVLPTLGLSVREAELQWADLMAADGVFLTNAIRGIRWVKQAGEKEYSFSPNASLYSQLSQTIYG